MSSTSIRDPLIGRYGETRRDIARARLAAAAVAALIRRNARAIAQKAKVVS